MSSSAESTLGITHSELEQNIARHMGVTASDHTAEITDIIRSGLNQFYYPIGADGIEPGFKWNFLRVRITNESVTAPANTFVLNDDFGGGIREITITNLDSNPIRILDRNAFEALKVGGSSPTGTPKYAAIYVSTAAGASESERYTVELYPTPDVDLTLSYEYDRIPDITSSSSEYPFGAQLHSETILASCMAVTEMRANEGAAGPFYEQFIAQLKTSIELDKNQVAGMGVDGLHPTTSPSLTTLAADYNRLRGEIGQMLNIGRDPQAWDYAQSEQVDRYIENGLNMFYWPPMVPGDDGNHTWSFLKPSTTLNTVADQEDYDLGIGVASVIGTFTYSSSDGYRDIIITNENMIRSFRASNVVKTGIPTHAALRWKSDDATAENNLELMLWPKPDAVYTLGYSYEARPSKLTSANLYTMAGPEHAMTIMYACKACVEDNIDGQYYKMYIQRMAGSLKRDKDRSTPEHWGYNSDAPYDHNTIDFRTTTVTYDGTQY